MQPFLASQAELTRSLQEALDAASWDLKQWTAGLPFIVRNTSHLPDDPANVVSEGLCDNILEYLKPMYRGYKIYFSAKYNNQNDLGFGGDKGWKDLLKDIEIAGMKAGFYPVSNGGNSSKRIMICRGSRMYQGKKREEHSPSKQNYRSESLHSDRNNSRGNTGKLQPRKTQTARALHRDSSCPFRFNVRFDNLGFYLVGGSGCAHHAHHPKVANLEFAIPTRLICATEKDILVSVGCAKANDGVGRNIHFSRCGHVIPRSQVRYINGFQNTGAVAGENGNKLECEPSTVDKLLKSLRDKGYDHCVLYHHVRVSQPGETEMIGDVPLVNEIDPGAKELMVNETYGLNDGDNCNAFPSAPSTSLKVVVLPNSEVDDMHSFAEAHRHSLLVEDKQDLMIGCAWTTPSEKRFFKMFSEVLHIDCTADTNHEDRPFLTITGRDSNGKMFTIVRAFLPNERAWVFRWLFQTVMPTLLGKEYIGRVRVIVTDGDSQETSQLDIAIALHFRNVCRVRCGWHIVDRGWIRCCPGVKSVSRENEKAFKVATNHIKNWIYSWMQGGCETEEEYKISKALLAAYLCDSAFLDIATEPVAQRIKTFVRENVEPLESFFCFHSRRSVRHFDTYTNSPHEGTNNGLKTGAAPVLPQHSLDRSASILNQNAQIKAASMQILSATAVSCSALWSNLPTSQKLTHKGEGLVTQQWKLRNEYKSQRIDKDFWLVVGKNINNNFSSGLIPRFSRVRQVSIVDDCILLCSCMHFERIGIPCRHQMHVLSAIDKEYAGISHHDVAVTWWKEFMKYGFSTEPSCQKVSSLYQKLLFNDIRGPSIPKGSELPPIRPNITDLSFVVKQTKETCNNYSVATINMALRLSGAPTLELRMGNEEDDFDDKGGGPCNTQQETNTYGDDDCVLVFPNHDRHAVTNVERTPYSVLVPLAKELAQILDGNCSPDELQKHKAYLSSAITGKKKELMMSKRVATGKMVSSSVASNKKMETHGTKHMKFR